jgi:hypothetical protein
MLGSCYNLSGTAGPWMLPWFLFEFIIGSA